MLTSALKLADYEKKYSNVSFDNQKNLVLNKYVEVEAQLKNNNAEILAIEKKIEKNKEELKTLSKNLREPDRNE